MSMKFVSIIPGSGDSFYCENCLRDLTLARALRKAGHDVLCVPLYLPPAGLEPRRGGMGPIFFGGINVYLQQKLAVFRRTPRFIDRLFDSRTLLRWAGHFSGMTSARDLAQTMLSMLKGPQGNQVKELQRLTDYLRRGDRPDFIVLSDALLLGLALPLREALLARVICFLQDEDEFVDALPTQWAQQVWQEMVRQAAHADAFVASSLYYAQQMRTRLQLAADCVEVIYDAVECSRPPAAHAGEPVIGFLSRLCGFKGLDMLLEAFLSLRAQERFANVRLRAFGGQTSADGAFLRSLRRRIADAGATAAVEFGPNVQGEHLHAFLAGLTVLSVPSRRAEAAGLCVLEAMAAGVPVVQPSSGVFPELIERTGGGVLFEPESVESLTAALGGVLGDVAAARRMGLAGRQAVMEHFSAAKAAGELERICREVTTVLP